jgi:CYTH domain-containing protein
MIELEKTFLAKFIPEGIRDGESMLDIMIPSSARHPVLRIRKKGEKFEMTKKYPVENDASKQHEFTIPLTKEEFEELEKNIEGKRLEKRRYIYDLNGKICKIDVFQKKLNGLVLVDFEFETEEEKENFQIPDFCLKEVTHEEFIAGGMLVGKIYEDIEQKLELLGYKRL